MHHKNIENMDPFLSLVHALYVRFANIKIQGVPFELNDELESRKFRFSWTFNATYDHITIWQSHFTWIEYQVGILWINS